MSIAVQWVGRDFGDAIKTHWACKTWLRMAITGHERPEADKVCGDVSTEVAAITTRARRGR